MKPLKTASYKSYDWINQPVIGENMFREYDLRNPMIPLTKGGKTVEPAINVDGIHVLGQAYGTYAQDILKVKKIVVGSDYRYYARGNCYAFITGVLSTGVDVFDIGTVLTPILYFAQYHFNLEGGAMVTASHNDNGWTGLKLGKGLSKTFGPEDIIAFKKLVYGGKFKEGKGQYSRFEGIDEHYFDFIKKTVQEYVGDRKLKVAVSGANGGGGHFLVHLVKKLGFELLEYETALDWDFPKFNPNPENVKFAEQFGKFVKEHKADLGVTVDGDGDRLGVVDENGTPIFADRAGLFIARFIIDKVPPGQKIVIDVKATGAYSKDPLLKKQNTEIVFTPTGHSYVKAGAQKVNAIAAFEKSGHFFMRGKFGHGYDDACMSSAWFLAALSTTNKKVSELIAEQPKSYQSPTMEPSTTNDRVKYEIVEKVKKEFESMRAEGKPFAGMKISDLITINGVRFIFENGSWGLIRASSNQPVLVVTAESFETRRQMYDIIEAMQHLLKQYKDVGSYDQQLPPYPGED